MHMGICYADGFRSLTIVMHCILWAPSLDVCNVLRVVLRVVHVRLMKVVVGLARN